MRRELYIELIIDYIKAKPGRAFEEVQYYAHEIGATEPELEAAVIKVSQEITEIKKLINSNSTKIETPHTGEKKEPITFRDASIILEGFQEKLHEVTKTNQELHDQLIDLLQQKHESVAPSSEKETQQPIEKTTDHTKNHYSKKISARMVKLSSLKHLKRPHITRRASTFITASFIILLTVLFVNNNAPFNKSYRQTERELSQNEARAEKSQKRSFGPPVVYATQDSLDPRRIFSYPASNITLDYQGVPQKEVFGFFPYWMSSVADSVNIEGYTTIALFGLTTDAKGDIITTYNGGKELGWEMWNSKEVEQLIERARKKRIKVVLTIKSFNNDDIEKLVASDEAQRQFISNAIQLVNLKSLDGINIDFEYIGTPPQETTFAFTRLIANLNAELKRQLPEITLTIDTYLKSGGEIDLFDIQLLENYVDAIVVMGYDVNTPAGSPGPVAPLEGPGGIIGYLQSYLERISPEKIILALPYYGYDWPVTGDGDRRGKAISYAELASVSSKNTIQWNDQSQTPYYTYIEAETGVTREVHFENSRSLGLKYDYVKKKNLKGVGVWAMGYEGLTLDLEQVLLEKFAK